MILLMYLDMSNCRSSLFFFTCHFSFVVNQSFQTFTFNFKKYIYVSNKIFMFICSLWQINTFIKYNLHVLKLNKFLKLMVKDENIWLRRKLIRYVKIMDGVYHLTWGWQSGPVGSMVTWLSLWYGNHAWRKLMDMLLSLSYYQFIIDTSKIEHL